MIITKKQVITALENEPLRPGQFIRYDKKPIGDCQVCAVGAVMRTVLNNNIEHRDEFSSLCENVTDFQYVGEDTDELLQNKNYMGALSNYFEEMMFDNDDGKNEWDDDEDDDGAPIVESRHRKELIQFVNDNFPEQFEVEVNV